MLRLSDFMPKRRVTRPSIWRSDPLKVSSTVGGINPGAEVRVVGKNINAAMRGIWGKSRKGKKS